MASENINSVQGILHDSLSSVGGFSAMRREGSTLSVVSLPATIMAPKPFLKSKIPIRHGAGQPSSGRSTPLNGSRSDLTKLRRELSTPPPVPPKPKLGPFQKTPLRREISSPPSLNDRRGSVDSLKGTVGPNFLKILVS